MKGELLTRLHSALADRYRIERELGAGGMATVYLAEDLKHRRQVAIKVLRADVAASIGADRFLSEIRLTATLQHPHILPLFDSGDVDGVPYYVMPYVDGETLRERVRREGRLAFGEALSIAADVAAALAFAHARDVVHRDVKPDNILLKDGEALVADFGIALAVARVGGERLTLTGTSVGTPAYMSPEQIGGSDVDGRTDQYALAAILYEMLTGAPPFDGATAQAILARTLTEPVQPPSTRGVSIPAAADAAIVRALAKAPEDRFASAREFIAACTPAAPLAPRSRWPVAAGVAAVLIAVASGAGFWWSQGKARAAALLPQIRAHAAAGDYVSAYTLARRAQQRLASDSAFQALFREVSDEITVHSDPAGARVFLATFGDTTLADSADGRLIGTTPLAYVVARGDHRLVVRAPGHEPVQRIATRFLMPNEGLSPEDRNLVMELRLPAAGSVPERMEPIPGGPYEIVGHDIGRAQRVELAPFALDRFEVSNDDFAAFVRAGGYRDRTLWRAAGDGVERMRLVDRTGLPAPRDWVNGEPPAGRGRHPVTGVSWHEATAYCAWRGGRLPSLFEWEKAARDGRVSRLGVLMPWGQYDPRSVGVVRANFSGTGTAPVDSYPFAISPYGIYNMAGNVKEWLANRFGAGWATTGGSWQDPMYLFNQVGSQAGEGSPALGFRCVLPLGEGKRTAVAGTGPLPPAAPAPRYRAVDEAGFPALLAHYRYDRRPANARGRTVLEEPDWIRERLWIDGPRGDSVLLYIYLPRSAAPPYQLLVHIPSSAAFFAQSVPQLVEEFAVGQIRAGRAVVTPVLAGMLERQHELPNRPAPPTVEFRDLMVRHATEMRLAMDYMVSRDDIDSTRIAYLAVSFGAGSRLVFAAVDPRFRAVVLIGAGIDERIQPTLPEAANFNFAPHINAPKLVINGRQDEEHPWHNRGQALWDLLREPRELLLVDGAGHVVPAEIRTPRINEFLDRTLGPVAGARR